MRKPKVLPVTHAVTWEYAKVPYGKRTSQGYKSIRTAEEEFTRHLTTVDSIPLTEWEFEHRLLAVGLWKWNSETSDWEAIAYYDRQNNGNLRI